mgnify:CR=1 FL=1
MAGDIKNPDNKKFKNSKEKRGKKIRKKDQGDILGDRFDKKLLKLAESKEAQLQADDFDAGVNRAEKRAAKEVAQEAAIPMARGGRAGFKAGSKGCKLAMKGRGRAYGKNS